MGLVQEFKEFAMRGNVVDMAVGIVMGSAFGKIVSALVSKVVMPPIGWMLAGKNVGDMAYKLPNADKVIVDGKEVVAEIGYGAFLQTIIDFLLIAIAIFLVIKLINAAKKRFEAEKEAEPDKPTADQELLTEIRDLLKKS